MAVLTPRVALIKQLNTLNQTAYGYGAVGFGVPWNRQGGAWVNAAGEGVLSTAGTDVVSFVQITLTELFSGLPEVLIVARSPDVHTLIDRLSRSYGVGLQAFDVLNGPVEWDGSNEASVTLRAAANVSRMFGGEVVLRLRATLTSIRDMILIPSVTQASRVVGDAALLAAVNDRNGTAFTVPSIQFSHNVVDHGGGHATTTISGVPGYGYTDDITIAMTRELASSVVTGQGFASKTAYTGSILDYIQTNTPAVFNLIPRSELIDKQVVYAGTEILNVEVAVKPDSYGFYGSFVYEMFPANATDVARIRGAYLNVAILPPSEARIRGAYLLVAVLENPPA